MSHGHGNGKDDASRAKDERNLIAHRWGRVDLSKMKKQETDHRSQKPDVFLIALRTALRF